MKTKKHYNVHVIIMILGATGLSLFTSSLPFCDAQERSTEGLSHPPSPLKDEGIWTAGDDHQVSLLLPDWIPSESLSLVFGPQKNRVALIFETHLLSLFTLNDGRLSAADITALKRHAPLALTRFNEARGHQDKNGPPARTLKRLWSDRDDDRIPDLIDLHIGAERVRLNNATYRGGYERISYPAGDVKRDHGVCTDVIIRTLRNAGWDLQEMIYKDMKRRPKSYGLKGDARPNRHIDHRRVRRQIVYFKRYYKPLPVQFTTTLRGDEVWLPGDIVFMDTFPNKSGPDHVGLVSDRLSAHGVPFILNNWTDGYSTSEMDLIPSIPITHRFRMTLRK